MSDPSEIPSPELYNTQSKQSSNTNARPIAGFWPRSFAFLIDGLLLAILGSILGFIFIDFFISLGEWGRLFGFVIALTYFGLLNSTLGSGQTLGKRLMSIKVVDAGNQQISLSRSLVRYSILACPYFLNGLVLPAKYNNFTIQILISLVLFGGGLCILYLYVFNSKTRQSLHDLFCGTYVVRSKVDVPVTSTPFWKGHFVALGTLAALAILLIGYLGKFVRNLGLDLTEVVELYQTLESHESIKIVGVHDKVTRSYSNSTGKNVIRHLDITAFSPYRIEKLDRYALEVARIAFANESKIFERDIIIITVGYRFNIGIANGSRTRSFRYTPEQWREFIRSKSDATLEI